MKPKHKFLPRRPLSVAIAAALLLCAAGARADERGDLEQLRATTLNLIDALVENGVLSREKADKLVRDATVKAAQAVVQAPVAATHPEVGKDGKRIVRVPYVPESMKQEIREQIKNEVLAQAKTERWGDPGALPDWVNRFHFEGDVRVRSDSFRLGKDNTAAANSNYITGTNLTRAAEFAGPNGDTLNGLTGSNAQEDFNRTRLRLRFGATAKVADTVSAGFRISTGSTTGPTSTNQTLGQNFNKYTVVLDRGYLTLKPWYWLNLTGGRIANPFFSTDLVWADDLNFEGVAAKYSQLLTPEFTAFATAGWFPLRTDIPLQTTSRDLEGFQVGFNWNLTPTTEFKLAASTYRYRGIEGQQESADRYTYLAPDYGTRYEYPSGLRQRGNTLFMLNAISVDGTKPTYWGLASGFRELNVTTSLDIAHFDPVHVVLTGDYVKNLAFDRATMSARAGSTIVDGKDDGYMARLLVGYPNTVHSGEWNVSLAYRYLGSDAVLDAFTNSDFGMGGTNNKGYILGFSYGLDNNAWLSARWLSSNLIDSMAPKVTGVTSSDTKLAVDLLQVDFNAKF
jgi:hypothetical protein